MAAVQIQKVSFRHEHIIDWLLANPGEKNMESLCQQLNVSRPWLSIVMNSDAFRAEYERRREEYNKELGETVVAKMYKAASKALDNVISELDDAEIDPRFALDVVDKTTNRLGFGAKAGATPLVEVNQHLHVVDSQLLAEARQAMRTTAPAASLTIDVVPDEG